MGRVWCLVSWWVQVVGSQEMTHRFNQRKIIVLSFATFKLRTNLNTSSASPAPHLRKRAAAPVKEPPLGWKPAAVTDAPLQVGDYGAGGVGSAGPEPPRSRTMRAFFQASAKRVPGSVLRKRRTIRAADPPITQSLSAMAGEQGFSTPWGRVVRAAWKGLVRRRLVEACRGWSPSATWYSRVSRR